MTERVQRIRGAIGIGLTWAVGWAPVGAITGWMTAAALGFPLGVVGGNYAVTFGVLGFVGGAIFSIVLRLAERGRRFDQLSLPRFVTWGALGGLVLGGLAVATGLLGAGLTTLGAVMAGASTLLGAGSAAGTLAIARGAHGRQPLTTGTGAGAGSAGKSAPRLLADAESPVFAASGTRSEREVTGALTRRRGRR